MASPIRMTARGTFGKMRLGCFVLCACLSVALSPPGIAVADPPQGTVVAWGAGGPGQSGYPHFGQSVVPSPNTGFIAIAAGEDHSLGLKGEGPS